MDVVRESTPPVRSNRVGTIPIIDTDVHEAFSSMHDLLPYLDDPWCRLIEENMWRGFVQPFAYWAPGGGNRADIEAGGGGPAAADYGQMQELLLDKYDIKVGILTGYFYPAMARMQFEFFSALAAAYNDYQIEHWLGKDERFRGSVHVVPQETELAVREIDRVGSHPQMVQVMLPIAKMAYGDPAYHPIFAAAARHDLAIAMHHTVFSRGALGMGRYYIERHMLIPQGTMAQIISLVCNGVFDKFPGLSFVFLEAGFTWLPHLLWRFDREYKSLRQEIPWVKRKPSQHIRERVRLSTQPTEDLSARQWMQTIDMIGSDEVVVFSTDYPHFDFDSPEHALPSGLPEDTRRKILFENARRLYDL